MQPTESPGRLGSAIESAYDDSLNQWLKEHRRGRDSEVALAQDLRMVTLSINLRRQRLNRIYVTVTGRQPWMTATYGYVLTRHKGDRYRATHIV